MRQDGDGVGVGVPTDFIQICKVLYFNMSGFVFVGLLGISFWMAQYVNELDLHEYVNEYVFNQYVNT